MAMLGPMVVVAEAPAADLVDILGKAGAFPIVETKFADAAAAVDRNPAGGAADRRHRARRPPISICKALLKTIENRGGPFMPVLARVDGPGIDRDTRTRCRSPSTEPDDRLVACLKSALRVRSQHAAVIRRAHSVEPAKNRARPLRRPARARDRAVHRPRPLLSGAHHRDRRTRRPDRRHERRDRRALSQCPRHRRHRDRRRLQPARGRSAADGARRGRALPRPAGRRARPRRGGRRPARQPGAGRERPGAAGRAARCRSCACRRSRAGSSACSSRSIPKAWSIRRPACSAATRSGAISTAPCSRPKRTAAR